MLVGEGKLISAYSHAKAQLLYIPAELVRDSAYPFRFEGKSLKVRILIKGNELVISRLGKPAGKPKKPAKGVEP